MVVIRKKVSKNPIVAFLSLGEKRKDWTYRRIVIFGLLAAGIVWVTWAAGWMRLETASVMISNAFNMIMAIAMTYVFGAVIDDHLRRRAHNEGGEEISETDIDPDNHPRADDGQPTDPDKKNVEVTVGINNSSGDAPPPSRNGG